MLFYLNFTAYIWDYLEEEKYGFCIHCNGSVMCGTCNVLERCCTELLRGDSSPYSILSDLTKLREARFNSNCCSHKWED